MTSFFPFLVTIMVLVGIGLATWLAKSISMGTIEGGPWELTIPEPPGQRDKPWELQAVEQQLVWSDPSRGGAPIVALLNQLVDASSLDNDRFKLPTYASRSQVEWVVAELERETGIRPGGNGP